MSMRKTSSGKPLSRENTSSNKRIESSPGNVFSRSGPEIVVIDNTHLGVIRQKIIRSGLTIRGGRTCIPAITEKVMAIQTPAVKSASQRKTLLSDLDGRFCSTGEIGSIKVDKNPRISSSSLTHQKENFLQGDNASSEKDTKIMLLSTKIRTQAKKILWLEDELTRVEERISFQNQTGNSESKQYSLQISLLVEENTLLKEKTSVLEDGLQAVRSAAEEESLRADGLEVELVRIKKAMTDEVLRSDSLQALNESQRASQDPSKYLSQVGQTLSQNYLQKKMEELVSYKLKADERIVQLTYLNEDLKTKLSKIGSEINLAERKAESVLRKLSSLEEKNRVSIHSLQAITEVVHMSVDAMNTVAKELADLRATNTRDGSKKPVQLADQLYRFVDMLENVLNTTSRNATAVPEAHKPPTPPKKIVSNRGHHGLGQLADTLKSLQQNIATTCL